MPSDHPSSRRKETGTFCSLHQNLMGRRCDHNKRRSHNKRRQEGDTMQTRRTTLKQMAGALAFGAGGLHWDEARAQGQTPKTGGTLVFAISAEAPQYDNHGSDTYATLHFAA